MFRLYYYMFMNECKAIEIFKALADPTRLDIVRRLAREPDAYVPSNDLVESCATLNKLSQPAMSHHFNKLVDAEVISERKIGTGKRYELNDELLLSIGIDPVKL